MRKEPLINIGWYVWEVKAQPSGCHHNNSPVDAKIFEQKGDLLICDFWKRGTGGIHDMHVVNTNALFQQKNSPEKCFQTA